MFIDWQPPAKNQAANSVQFLSESVRISKNKGKNVGQVWRFSLSPLLGSRVRNIHQRPRTMEQPGPGFGMFGSVDGTFLLDGAYLDRH